MKPITILTATYNHPSELKKLYESLCKQSNKDFTWVIVNDGSKNETENLLNDIAAQKEIDVVIVNKQNGGKGSAINCGLDRLEQNVEFVLIIDDDERLNPDAITTVKEYVNKYKNSECGVIHFNRKNEKGEVIATPVIIEDFFMPYQQFKSQGRHADGYLGYYIDKLGNNRFSIFPKEKYIAPSTLFMKTTKTSKLLWAAAVLGETEYLAGGITRQGRRLRIRNPKGMIEYCELMQENGASLKTKYVYSVQGYAYSHISNEKYNNRLFMKTGYLPGIMLAEYWKRRYPKTVMYFTLISPN